MRPQLPDDDPAQYASIMERLRRLEQRVGRTIIVPVGSPVSGITLGEVDGENITGVRIVGNIITGSTGGNTFLYLQPNALNPITTQTLERRTYWDTASQISDHQYGGDGASAPGLVVAEHNWATSANAINFDGIFHTTRLGGAHYRKYLGSFVNEDYVSNHNRWVFGAIACNWKDTSTNVASLRLALGAGTFVGRISLEILP